MAYRVDYQPIKKIRGAEKRVAAAPALTALCLVLFFLLVHTVWPRGAQVLRGLLFSGDTAVTGAALELFAQDLRAGEAFSSALQTFCRTILAHAGFGSY